MRDTSLVQDHFLKHFPGDPGLLYFAPGRINLIGEHTDYNGGYVFPGAVDKGILAALRPNGTDQVRAYSIDLDEHDTFGLGEGDCPSAGWAKYLFGVCRELIKLGVEVKGFDTVFTGDVPLGAGMSSSAAIESCYATALNDLFGSGKVDKMELARVGQRTEHLYVGVKCGIMDQFISIHGQAGHLLRLDCRSMEYTPFPFDPKGYKLLLLDSAVKHELASSAYNDRRHSCEAVVEALRATHPEVQLLRDVDRDMLESVRGKVSGEDLLRAEYVVGEHDRVLAVSEALERGDYETVGQKMYETHQGMSKQYEVSCEELDLLVDIAKKCGVTGARVMGGGFGGCTINLVKDELADAFVEEAKRRFSERFGHEPHVYSVTISDGARRLA